MAGFEDFVARYPGCVGCWPLDDPAAAATGVEPIAGRVGTYTHVLGGQIGDVGTGGGSIGRKGAGSSFHPTSALTVRGIGFLATTSAASSTRAGPVRVGVATQFTSGSGKTCGTVPWLGYVDVPYRSMMNYPVFTTVALASPLSLASGTTYKFWAQSQAVEGGLDLTSAQALTSGSVANDGSDTATTLSAPFDDTCAINAGIGFELAYQLYTGYVARAQQILAPGGPLHPVFGGGGYVTVPSNAAFSPEAGASSGQISVLAVVYPTALGSAQMILTKHDGTGGNAEYQLRGESDGSVLFSVDRQDGGQQAMQCQSAAGVLALNTPAVVLAAYKRTGASTGTITVWANGVQVAQSTSVVGSNAVTAGAAPVQIGRRSDSGGNPWAGSIGFPAIFNTALAQADATLIQRAFVRNAVSVG